jgi:hypothetical protein
MTWSSLRPPILKVASRWMNLRHPYVPPRERPIDSRSLTSLRTDFWTLSSHLITNLSISDGLLW